MLLSSHIETHGFLAIGKLKMGERILEKLTIWIIQMSYRAGRAENTKKKYIYIVVRVEHTESSIVYNFKWFDKNEIIKSA